MGFLQGNYVVGLTPGAGAVSKCVLHVPQRRGHTSTVAPLLPEGARSGAIMDVCPLRCGTCNTHVDTTPCEQGVISSWHANVTQPEGPSSCVVCHPHPDLFQHPMSLLCRAAGWAHAGGGSLWLCSHVPHFTGLCSSLHRVPEEP